MTAEIALTADFLSDVREEMAQRLLACGVAVPASLSEWDVTARYYDFARRRIPVRPRRVEWSKELRQKSLLSAELAGLHAIEEDAKAGVDLVPYRSKTWDDLTVHDMVYNDWGIHHFHLGGRTLGRDGFVKRTGPLLYAMCRPGVMYFVDVLDHESFADDHLVQVVHDNWPALIADARCPDASNPTPFSRESRRALSRNRRGFNALLLVEASDGTVYMSPGGGYSSSGLSWYTLRFANWLLQSAHDLQRQAKDNIGSVADAIERHDGQRPKSLRLKLKLAPSLQVVQEAITSVTASKDDGTDAWVVTYELVPHTAQKALGRQPAERRV